MGPNEHIQHFEELRQKVCFYIHTVALPRGLPSLDGINKLFVGKKGNKLLAKPSQTDYIVYKLGEKLPAKAEVTFAQSTRMQKN